VTTKIMMKGAVVASDLNGAAVVQECEVVAVENELVETSPERGKEMTRATEGAVQGRDNAAGDDEPVFGQWTRYCPAAGDVEMQKGPEHRHCSVLHLRSLSGAGVVIWNSHCSALQLDFAYFGRKLKTPLLVVI
jgi:hypothetical protein